jgi:pimeloyl-ACP methyl ester carboxylesterase
MRIWTSSRRPAWRRAVITATILIAGLFSAAPTAIADASSTSGPTCSAHTLNVAITDPGPADQTIWGQLCYRGNRPPSTIQLLVSGITYTHLYWDFPYGDGYYSYVDAATADGYATFDVDRIGQGLSSHPVSSALTIDANAVSLHDVVTALRGGVVDGYRFSRVIWVGHSAGSIIGWDEIARYHDVDAAILTGVSHAINLPNAIQLSEDLYPAVDDPLFADSGLDDGYLTTQPGTRSAFYAAATADPHVVALDEATKGTVTTAESATEQSILMQPPDQALSQQVTVPVLVIDGQDDGIYCQGVTVFTCDPASVLAYESQFYPPQAHLQVAIIPDTGHVLALSTTAPLTDAIMLRWARSTIAP